MNDWKSLLDCHGPMVWRTVYRLLKHHADASDCFQETFLSFVKISRAQAIDEPGAMLRAIATLRAIDRLRQRIRERKLAGEMPGDELPSLASNPAKLAEQAEMADQLRAALTELPDKQAQAYCLRFMEDLSYEQIAKTMEITVDSAGVLLHRARQRLRELMMPSQVKR